MGELSGGLVNTELLIQEIWGTRVNSGFLISSQAMLRLQIRDHERREPSIGETTFSHREAEET